MEIMNKIDVSYLTNTTTTAASFIKSNDTISKIQIGNKVYDIDETNNYVGKSVGNLENEINKIWEKLNTSVNMIHNCQNCGATLEIEENKPIFHCKYCNSVYVVGSARLKSI